MILFTLLLVLFSFPLYLVSKTKKEFTDGLIISVFSIPLIIYLTGLLINIKIGCYIAIFLSIIFYILAIINMIKKKNIKSIFKQTITPALFMWLVFYILAFIINDGRMFIGNDEFSHWGDVIKTMFLTNDFSTSKLSLSMFQSYPPAVSIFQYFM